MPKCYSLRPLFVLLSLAVVLSACQRGEKSCRYYSLVLQKSDDPFQKKEAIQEIRLMHTKDQLKCDDDKVFKRFADTIDKAPPFRPPLVEMLESLGKANEKLRTRCQTLLVKAIGYDDTAAIAARIVRTWRLDAADKGKTWLPNNAIVKALAAAMRRVKNGETKESILQSLWLSLDDKKKLEYEDLLIQLADADPATQTVGVNLKALKYLTDIRSKKDTSFEAYFHGLFQHDAARSETYGQARLALAVIPPNKVADKILGVLERRDESFDKWSKEIGLFKWEWQEGPKLAQILSDVHDPRTAKAIITRIGKSIDATETGTPKTFALIKKGFPWASYITSRLQLSMWGLAAMGEGLKDVAEDIGNLAKTQGPTVEQRTMPFLGLAVSGASNSWSVMLKTLRAIEPRERADFITPMAYALEPQYIAEWDRFIVGDKSEGVQKAIADPTIVARVNVVRECKKATDAAPNANAKIMALGGCYSGFLKTGDNLAKEKAALGLVHLASRGVDVITPILAAFEKSTPADTTLRQVLMVGLKVGARPKHMKAIYKTQQRQVQVGNNQTWGWEFDILLGHLLTQVENIKLPAAKPDPKAAGKAAAKPK
jgi:uncharacterized lipoprotein YmbA